MRCWLLAAVTALIGCGAVNREIRDNRDACDDGSGAACLLVGTRYATGTGVKKDDRQAVRYFEKGCSWKSAASCYALANAILLGTGTPRRPYRGRQFLELACSYGEGAACDRPELWAHDDT